MYALMCGITHTTHTTHIRTKQTNNFNTKYMSAKKMRTNETSKLHTRYMNAEEMRTKDVSSLQRAQQRPWRLWMTFGDHPRKLERCRLAPTAQLLRICCQMQEVRGSNARLGGLGVGPFQASGGMKHPAIKGLRPPEHHAGHSIRTKRRLLRLKHINTCNIYIYIYI